MLLTLLLDSSMKLNKKYTPNLLWKSKNKKSEGYYPIFLPSYKSFSSQELVDLHYADLMARNLVQFTESYYIPLLVTGGNSIGEQLILKGKSGLPFFWKWHRLLRAQHKQLKKTDDFLESFFHQKLRTISLDEYDAQKLQSVFDLLVEKKRVQQSFHVVYWDISAQTTVNEDEIERREELQPQLEVKCFVETKNEVLTLIVSDVTSFFEERAVIVHANDKRYKKHIGKKIIIPIINKSIPIYGEENIDTVKDNGIVRVNPLLGTSQLQKALDYKLEVQQSYIDEQGNFIDGLEYFSGKPLLEFRENIIDTLDTIWNLASKTMIPQQVPYSRNTGQRLLKRILPLYRIDISSQKEVFLTRLHEHYPTMLSLYSDQDSFFLPLESKSHFSPYCFREGEEKLYFWFPVELLAREKNLRTLMIASLYSLGYLKTETRREELIDMLYLLPHPLLLRLMQLLPDHRPLLETYHQQLANLDADQLLEELIAVAEHATRMQILPDGKGFKIIDKNFCSSQYCERFSLDLNFLKALVLSVDAYDNNYPLVCFLPMPHNLLKTLLVLAFLYNGKLKIKLMRQLPELQYPHALNEKIEVNVKKYGRDTLRLTLAKQEKQEEKNLDQNFAYLNHYRNIFKFLYEKWALDKELPASFQIQSIDVRMWSQWEELLEGYEHYQTSGAQLPQLLERLQAFTQSQFTRYLEFIKKEQHLQSYQVASQIFLQTLQVLTPYLPMLVGQIEEILWYQLPPKIQRPDYQGKKDYKIHLLFDIIKGINQQKQQKNLKKHQAIKLAIKGNSEILKLVEKNQEVFHALLRAGEIALLTGAEVIPTSYETFTLLDITLGIKLLEPEAEKEELPILEKKYKERLAHLEYIRSTLMMLSSNPLADTQKIHEKEQELQDIKDEIDGLDIRIKKLKMQKKY